MCKMSERFTAEEYKSLRLEWKKQLDKYPLQQLDPTPNLLNEFIEQLWSDSKKMMDLLITTTTTTTTESCNLIMQDFCFKQMKCSLYTRQRLFDILEAEPISKKYMVASTSPSSLSLASSLSFSSCIMDSDSISKSSSELDNTPLLTNSLSSSTIEVNSITQTSLDQTQIGIKQKEEEENDSISTNSSNKADSHSKQLKLSPSPSTPTLGRSFTLSCEASFLPACNYLCYYPTYNSKKEKGGTNTCHFCNEPITPLKKSFSMGDFSNRQLSDDASSCYTLDESITFTDDHTSNHHKMGDSEIVINSNEFQPLLPINKNESNMEYCLITPTTKTEDRYLYYSNTLSPSSSSSSITQGKQQQEEEEDENGYKHLSSVSKDSNDDDSLDSVIQKHQDIISHYSLNSTSSKKKRRSMLRLFSHKKLSNFFSIKKKKKVDSVSSFYQKKMSELLI